MTWTPEGLSSTIFSRPRPFRASDISPRGNRVAFARLAGNHAELVTQRIAGGDRLMVTGHDGFIAFGFSADRARIAYLESATEVPMAR